MTFIRHICIPLLTPIPYAALVTAVAAGFANPSLGCLADRYYLSKFSTVGIFVVSG